MIGGIGGDGSLTGNVNGSFDPDTGAVTDAARTTATNADSQAKSAATSARDKTQNAATTTASGPRAPRLPQVIG